MTNYGQSKNLMTQKLQLTPRERANLKQIEQIHPSVEQSFILQISYCKLIRNQRMPVFSPKRKDENKDQDVHVDNLEKILDGFDDEELEDLF